MQLLPATANRTVTTPGAPPEQEPPPEQPSSPGPESVLALIAAGAIGAAIVAVLRRNRPDRRK